MKAYQIIFRAVITLFISSTVVFATPVMTFDDITTDAVAAIPENYKNLTWNNFEVIDSVAFFNDTKSGYFNGRVSGSYVATNCWADPASIQGDSFDFIGAYLAAAWRTDLSIDLEGYRANELVYSRTVTVDCTCPTWFRFNFIDVDKVFFNSYGGVEHPNLMGSGEHFVMDNIIVPEPTTVLLLGLGAWRVIRRRN